MLDVKLCRVVICEIILGVYNGYFYIYVYFKSILYYI